MLVSTEPTTVAVSGDGRAAVGAPRRRGRLHRPPRRALVPLLLVLGLLVWWLFPRPQPGSGPVVASGTLEVEEVTLNAETAGRVADLQVDEGSRVTEGQVLGRLSDPVLDVQARQAVVDAAQQQVAQAQMSRLRLLAPMTGVVQKRLVHRGEYVGPGTPILTVADPTELRLTLYVFEPDLARVAVGQSVNLRADGYGDRVFQAVVRTIASRAEFTPRNVQTKADRQNLVFAVSVRVPNADAALKAGLPVDATFE